VKDASTILVVEDESNDQFLIKTALRDVGATGPIQIVDDGLEAIAYMMGEGKLGERYPQLHAAGQKRVGE
jgi:CheY-like chemotaxis protein